MRTWLFHLASTLGLLRLFAFFNRRKVTILVYHGVSAREDFPGIENCDGNHVRLSRFQEHLRLISARYHVLPLSDLLHALNNNQPLPPSSVVLTFENGYANNATVALPCLRDAGMTATFLLSTSYIDTERGPWHDQIEQVLCASRNEHVLARLDSDQSPLPLATTQDRRHALRVIRDFCSRLPDGEKGRWLVSFFETNGMERPGAAGDYRFMTWDQAREIYAAGMSIGSQTVSHTVVTRLTGREMLRELNEARLACEEALGVACDAFAYPNGGPGEFNEVSGALLRRLEFSCGLTNVHGLNVPGADPFTLKRIHVRDGTSVAELEAHLSGFTGFLRGRLRRHRR